MRTLAAGLLEIASVLLGCVFSFVVCARDVAKDPPLKPADPLATPEGRFAHSIGIPNPLPADSGYRPGMTSGEYFDHLCRTEAGEFILKTVENVAGLAMLRPRELATDEALMDRYALEDPYGVVLGALSRPQDYYVQPTIGQYKYLEVPKASSSHSRASNVITRYFRSPTQTSDKLFPAIINGKTAMVPYVVAKSSAQHYTSAYGYTWRGLRREKDRELGIAGGELIVMALESREVIAVRRGYILSGHASNSRTKIWWPGGRLCANALNEREHKFIAKVLIPAS